MMTERFFDWTNLPLKTAEFSHRRQRLQQQLLQSGGGVFIFPSNSSLSDGFTFRQLNDFLYWLRIFAKLNRNFTAIYGHSGYSRSRKTILVYHL